MAHGITALRYRGPASMAYPLLTSRLSNIVIVSYAVPPDMLAAFVPPGPDGAELEIETRAEFARSGEPQGIVSLMAMEHSEARILGVRWPGLRRFRHIGLRFYVRVAGRRGTVYIRHIVSTPLIAWCGKRIENEPVVGAPISTDTKQAQRTIGVEYRLKHPEAGLDPGTSVTERGKRHAPLKEHILRVFGVKPVVRPAPDSFEHWLKERPWSFGMDRRGRACVTEIIHPTWSVYPVAERDLRIDFGEVFGPEWARLGRSRPVSEILAIGSEVAVFPKSPSFGVRWGERHAGG